MAEATISTSSGPSYSSGSARFIDRFRRAVAEALKPPPKLTLSQWADRYAHLSAETSADAGKFRAFGYQNGIMDAVTDPAVRQVTVMKSARVGYTKILDHVVGYFIHQDPSPLLLVQPRVEDAEDYSRTEIAPMLRDTPVLAEIAGDLKAKDSNQRILKRVFRNGASVAFIGANSPGGFRRITARVAAFDEIDGYPVGGAGDEGDQIALGIKRTESFWNRKIILGSTPTIKGGSRIEKAWNESDQRRYHVPCPGCGHMQVLRWANLHWNKDRDEQGRTIAHHPETAHFVCEANGCIIEEHSKPAMVDAGEWIAERPSAGHAGFHIWAAYSLFENAAWRFLVEEFLRVRGDPPLLQTFVNLVLGETWEEQGETVEANALVGRAEVYGPDALPKEVTVLVAGIDTQDDRLELQVVGYGAREEAWPCLYEVIRGDPAQPDVWTALDALLLKTFTTEDGRKLRVRAACIDSGGHHAERVYAFSRPRRNRRVWATKGAGGARPIWPKRVSRGGVKGQEQVYVIGVDTAKDATYGRLRIKKPGPGYIHFPVCAPDEPNGFDNDFFDQLTSEHVVTRYREGRPYRVWVLPKGKRNEALDTFVLALAALKSLPFVWSGWSALLRPLMNLIRTRRR
ncbi:phage terminase large subunit family protein [Methylobacterium organophilum]|nr:phage terminase large subunit family protein [Methylobacterium organophilum]